MLDKEYLINNGVDMKSALELLGDMDTYNSIVTEYVDGLDNELSEIKKFKEMADMPNYCTKVHALKSSSRYVGFMKLGSLAEEQEYASKAWDMDKVNSGYSFMVSEALRAKDIINTYLGRTNNNQKQTEEINTMLNTSEADANKKTILIADDSSIIRNFVTDTFKGEYNVESAETGREVANIISKDPTKFSALLLDLNMPEISGYQVLEWFKQNNLFAYIPVSVITGADDKDSILKINEYPVVEMLIKPFDKETVKRVVEKTVGYKSMSR